VQGVRVPARSDSEGLLAMPELQALAGTAVGLVTAPGGRGLLAPALAARGAQVRRADVYQRLPPRFDRRHRARLQALGPDVALLLSSGEALAHFLHGLAPEAAGVLARARVVVASPRLAELARQAGARAPRVAASAAPADLVAALRAA
jgi:uroporphyrinogen-III synthase